MASRCVSWAILEWHIQPSEAWSMSYREWLQIANDRNTAFAKDSQRVDYDYADDLESFVRENGWDKL
jgi:hypothetical protein